MFVFIGLMTSEELKHLEDLPSPHNKFWVPCMWFVNLALRARTEGRINNDVALTAILTVCFHLQFCTCKFGGNVLKWHVLHFSRFSGVE